MTTHSPQVTRWRARTHLQRQLRRERFDELRRLRGTVARATATVMLFSVVWLSLWPHEPIMWLAVGFLVGMFVMTVVLLVTIRTYTSTMGSAAEAWTRDELHRRRGWAVFGDVPLDHGNIDHVAFAPAGTFALESKWVGRRSAPYDRWVWRDLEQATVGAGTLRNVFAADGVPIRVATVLVLWGPGVPTDLRTEKRQGAWVVPGRELRAFLTRYDLPNGEPVPDPDAVARFAEEVAARQRAEIARGR